MQHTYELDTRLADDRSSAVSGSTGRFARMFSVVGLALYAAFAVTALLVAPSIAQSPVVWVHLAITVSVAGLTFYIGSRIQRS
jgi:hypothetical protein